MGNIRRSVVSFFRVVYLGVLSLLTSGKFRDVEPQTRVRVIFLNLVLFGFFFFLTHSIVSALVTSYILNTPYMIVAVTLLAISAGLLIYLRVFSDIRLPSIAVSILLSVAALIGSVLLELPVMRGLFLALALPTVFMFLFDFAWATFLSIVYYGVTIALVRISVTSDLTRGDIISFVAAAGVLLLFSLVNAYLQHRSSRALDLTTREVMEQQSKTDAIFNNANAGLGMLSVYAGTVFIGDLCSQRLINILERPVHSRPFIDLITEILPDKDIERVRDWVAFFTDGVKFKLIQKSNPLVQIETTIPSASRKYPGRNKILTFSFGEEADSTSGRYILTCEDVTDEVLQAREIQRERDEKVHQAKKFHQLLNQDPGNIHTFLKHTDADVATLNALLHRSSPDDRAALEKTRKIYQIIHAIKGNARLLEFDAIASKLHEFENSIRPFLETPPDIYTMIDFTSKIGDISDELDSIKETVAGIRSFTERYENQRIDSTQIVRLIEKAANRESSHGAKTIRTDFHAFDESLIPARLEKTIMDVAVIFLRNSVAHGIEEPAERIALGKNAEGTFRGVTRVQDGSLFVEFSDDGSGINYDAVRAKAISKGWLSTDEDVSPNKLASFMFKNDFSTNDLVDEVSGRGAGLSYVADILKQVGARISLRTKKGAMTTFTVKIPLLAEVKELEEVGA
jgi:two-component system chemotaxis sensor kinase CheA